MPDDQMPPGLFYDPDLEAQPEPPLTPDEEEFADAELEAIKRLETVRDENGELPPEKSRVLAFRNEAGEPVVVPTAVATEAERAFRCYQRWLRGDTWFEIAQDEKYPSPTACKADVDRYLAEGRSLVLASSAAEMLELEIARLTGYTRKLADRIEEGSLPAITEARHLAMARAQLYTTIGAALIDTNDGQRTVVIPAGSDYVGSLKEAAGESTPATEPAPGD